MDDDRRGVREYYQVNLDTGRIFWIAFLLGLVLVGILILGIYVGGGKLKKGLTIATRAVPGGAETAAEPQTGRSGDLPILGLFENGLGAETKYIDSKEAEKTALESSRDTIETARLFEHETEEDFDAEAAYRKAEQERPSTRAVRETPSEQVRPSGAGRAARETVSPVRRYVARGDYFIQVASFTKPENADRLSKRLERNLYKVSIEEATVGEQRFYRVRVGPFETKGVAVNTMTTMKRHFGLKDPFVVKKDP